MAGNTDLFNRDSSRLNGVFTSDRVKLILPEQLGVLVQQVQTSYAQAITRLYEVGSNEQAADGKNASNIYYVGGRTQGSLNLSRVVGPQQTIKAMYDRFGDVCAPESLAIVLQETNCHEGSRESDAKPIRYIYSNAVIQQVGMSVSAQDMVINESLQMIFSSLKVDNNSSTAV